MNADDKEMVLGCIESEGFDYAFRYYSAFEEVKDKKFHKLREAYVKTAQELQDYLDEGTEE